MNEEHPFSLPHNLSSYPLFNFKYAHIAITALRPLGHTKL